MSQYVYTYVPKTSHRNQSLMKAREYFLWGLPGFVVIRIIGKSSNMFEVRLEWWWWNLPKKSLTHGFCGGSLSFSRFYPSKLWTQKNHLGWDVSAFILAISKKSTHSRQPAAPIGSHWSDQLSNPPKMWRLRWRIGFFGGLVIGVAQLLRRRCQRFTLPRVPPIGSLPLEDSQFPLFSWLWEKEYVSSCCIFSSFAWISDEVNLDLLQSGDEDGEITYGYLYDWNLWPGFTLLGNNISPIKARIWVDDYFENSPSGIGFRSVPWRVSFGSS